MVKVFLRDLKQSTLAMEEELPVSSFGKEISILEPVKVNLKLNKSGDKISVSGVVRTAVELTCSRCLEKFSYNIDTDIDIVYQPAEKEPREIEELKEEDFKIATYDEPVLNLADDIREAVYLAVPIKPLCREDCQGICPKCGKNLNVKKCGCIKEMLDPRFAKLKEFFK